MTPKPCVTHRPPRRADRAAGAGLAGPAPPLQRGAALGAALLAGLLAAACAGPPARPPSPTQTLALTSSERAATALQRGDLAQAQTRYQAALGAAVALQDPALTGAALLNLTLVSARLGDLAAAHGHVDRILDAPGQFDAAIRARASARKALLYLDAGEKDQALRWAEQAGALCASPCPLAAMLGNLRGHLALASGDAAAAAALAGTAAAAAAAAGQDGERAAALRLQALAAGRLGDPGRAAESLAQALQIDRRLGQPDRVALDLLFAGDNEQQRGNRALADDFYQRALSVYEAVGDARGAEQLRRRLSRR